MWEATGMGSRELMDFVKEEESRIKKLLANEVYHRSSLWVIYSAIW